MKFSEWKVQHPTAYKRAKFILIGVALAFVLLGIAKVARGANVTMTCPTVPTVAGTVATCTVGDAPTPPIPPTPPVTNCPNGTVIHEGGASNQRIMFSAGQFHVYAFTAGTSAGIKKSQFAPYGGGGSFGWAVSTQACDLSGATAVPWISSLNGNVVVGQKTNGYAANGQFNFALKLGANVATGQRYYLNIQAIDCGTCGLVGNFVTP